MAASELHLDDKTLINIEKVNEAEVTQNTATSQTPSTLCVILNKLCLNYELLAH